MLVIKIELWPGGSEDNKKLLGTMHIYNDGSGDREIGNYKAAIYASPEYTKDAKVWKHTEVKNFPRLIKGPFDLLYRALYKMMVKRNKE